MSHFSDFALRTDGRMDGRTDGQTKKSKFMGHFR